MNRYLESLKIIFKICPTGVITVFGGLFMSLVGVVGLGPIYYVLVGFVFSLTGLNNIYAQINSDGINRINDDMDKLYKKMSRRGKK